MLVIFLFGAENREGSTNELPCTFVYAVKDKKQLHKNNYQGEELPPSTLELVQIYFDTATFDDIERDKKIKTEAQLSLIGGTMGLLTGFSIISSIEIIFFLFRFVSCLLIVHVPDIHIFLVQVGMLFPLAQVASKLEMIVFFMFTCLT